VVKLSLIDFIKRYLLYTVILLLLGGAVYYFAFWRGHNNRVVQLDQDVVDARNAINTASYRAQQAPQLEHDIYNMHTSLSADLEELNRVTHQWENNYVRFLPSVFDEQHMEQRLRSLIGQHMDAGSVDISFHFSEPHGGMDREGHPGSTPEGLWRTPIDISFSANYDTIMSILGGFIIMDGVDNRVFNYTVARNGPIGGDFWDVWLQLEVLTRMPQPGRYNGDFSTPDYGYGYHDYGQGYDYWGHNYGYDHEYGYNEDNNNYWWGSDDYENENPEYEDSGYGY